MKTIIDFLKKSNSNKQSMHRYGFIYDLLFTRLYAQKQEALNLLEIGVSEYVDGSFSLYAWGNAEIIKRAVGIDLKSYPGEMTEKMVFYELDAYTCETVDYLREVEGSKFDVIIHDGVAKKENQPFFLTTMKICLLKMVFWCVRIFLILIW